MALLADPRETQVAIVHYSLPRIALPSIGLLVLELVLKLLIVLPAQLDLPLPFLLPILNRCESLLLPLLAVLFLLQHFVVELLFHLLLLLTNLNHLLLFFLSQVIVFLLTHHGRAHGLRELLLGIGRVARKLGLFLHLRPCVTGGWLGFGGRLLQNELFIALVELSKRVHPRH